MWDETTTLNLFCTCAYYFICLLLGIFEAYLKIQDVLIKIKRSIVETVDVWNTRLAEVTRKKDTDKKKDKPTQIESEPSTEETGASEIANDLVIDEQPEKGTSNLIFKKLKSLDINERK